MSKKEFGNKVNSVTPADDVIFEPMAKPLGPTLNGQPILRGPGLCVFCGKPADLEYHFECKALADEFMHDSISEATSQEGE